MAAGNPYVMTVRGPIDPDRLGIAMTHEHVFCDLGCWAQSPNTLLEKELTSSPLAMEILGEVRRDALVFPDNLTLHDADDARDELADLIKMGGTAIVDCTVQGLEPRLPDLVALSAQLDLHVVVGCGYYVHDSHPPRLEHATVEGLTVELLQTISHGFEESAVRPGIIGEIGTSQPVHPREWRVLEAACNAQVASGLALFVHVHPFADGATAPEVVRFMLAHGVSPQRCNVCHMDGRLEAPYLREVLEMGVYVSFDTFGLEAYYDSIDRHSSFDADRERMLLALLAEGYERQLLLSQDVCMKMQLRRYVGQGYSHILRHTVPSLRRRGVDQRTLDTLLRDNPRRLLAVG